MAMQHRALVLGSGGVTGVAWEVGMIAGLAEHGIDLTEADLVVGTSAGSVVGVDVRSGVSISDIYAQQLAPPGDEPFARMGPRVIAGLLRSMVLTRDPVRARRRIGRLALAARTEPEQHRRGVIASRLPVHEWPARRLVVTAVDAGTGEFTTFDAASGVSLVDAVGASCAVPGVWPPVSIGGRRYIDGGMRATANVDLAAGYRQVVVIAPLPRGVGRIAGVARQVAELPGSPSVAVIVPGKAAVSAIGRNLLDPASRQSAARAGYAQAATEAERIGAVWLAGRSAADEPDPAAGG
ncbi:MAG TPA: patatin-like phospholipase family protein [Streptosporangiaceae bacterium]